MDADKVVIHREQRDRMRVVLYPAYFMDWNAYRKRNQIERLVNRLKQYRRVAARYDKRADCYGAFVTLAAIRRWL